MYIYMEQKAWVKWGDTKSSQMSISNGTRQGAILSPIFWSVYSDPLIQRLRALGLGAHVAGLFVGAVCYADDVLLIAPTRNAMQRMLVECEAFAGESNIEFSTDPVPHRSKTKCIFVTGKRQNKAKPAPLYLCGRELPFVSQAEHLGNMLTEQGDMEQDSSIKRAQFIQGSVKTRELFKFAAPSEVVKALKVYNSSFYGSNLWDLEGDKTRQVYTAWNTAVKLAWGCPQQTRTFFLHNLLSCGFSSARVDILTRFVKFYHSLRHSPCYEVQVLSRLFGRDVRSTTGKNLKLIKEETDLNPWSCSPSKLKTALIEREWVDVPPIDRWRLPYLCTLLAKKREAFTMAMEEEENRLSRLIASLVIN